MNQKLRQSVWSTLNLTLNWLYRGDVPGDGRGERGNPHLCIWWIQTGSVSVRYPDGRSLKAGKGDWVVLPAGTRHQDFSPQASLYSICVIAKWPDGNPLLERGLPVKLTRLEGQALEQPVERLHRFANRELILNDRTDPYSRMVTGCLVTAPVFLELEESLFCFARHLLEALARKGVRPVIHQIHDLRVLEALDLLENTPLQLLPEFSRIAQTVGLSEGQLIRQFKHWVGHTPKQHLHLRKIETAKALLKKNELQLKEVAFRLGFPSQSAFSNWCTTYLGESPRALRQNRDALVSSGV